MSLTTNSQLKSLCFIVHSSKVYPIPTRQNLTGIQVVHHLVLQDATVLLNHSYRTDVGVIARNQDLRKLHFRSAKLQSQRKHFLP